MSKELFKSKMKSQPVQGLCKHKIMQIIRVDNKMCLVCRDCGYQQRTSVK